MKSHRVPRSLGIGSLLAMEMQPSLTSAGVHGTPVADDETVLVHRLCQLEIRVLYGEHRPEQVVLKLQG